MKYNPIDNKLFIENRKHFAKKLKANSLAVFNSNDIMPTSADGTMPFVQDADIFYLSGIDQEESILVIFPDAKSEENREILFLKETNDHIAIWEGHKYTKEEATAASGIRTVYWLSQFKTVFKTLMSHCQNVYLNTNEHTRAVAEVETREDRFIKWCKEYYPVHNYKRAAPLMHELRAIKSKAEIELIQKACDITGKGFRRLLGFVKPGVWEYEIEAELSHEFIRNRSRGFAYGPIIASGSSANVLHYIDNNKQCKNGEVILLDVAAEYANYASDLTRCLPVSGKFSKRQKSVYNAVLRVQRAAIKMMKVGNTLEKLNREVGDVMQEELIKLRLLKGSAVKKQDPRNPLYKKYFMHGTSHYMGLNVHDVGDFSRPFEEGMVLTCEPGIYIRAEKLGIRLENDILITKKGPVDLMKNIPIEADEIEEIMNKK
ncbi:MAG: aminopeptidase P family protein [Bacteroidetes bacterium]|nr:aminopeptidase P family protein [Bacteroidota bacterium]